MPLAKTQLERNTFVKGLVTEASPLTFPENASIDEDNMILNRDGSRQRRLGMEFENNAINISTNLLLENLEAANINTYRWRNVNNKPTLSFGVVQVRNALYFFDLQQTTLSANKVSVNININTIAGEALMDFTEINGKLVVVSNELDKPLLIRYNEPFDNFFTEEVSIKVRDIWGVEDGLEIDEHPATLSATHQYNLHNQGWPEYMTTMAAGPNVSQYAYQQYQFEQGVYPANNQIWYFGKTITPTSNSQEVFGTGPIRDTSFGTTPAPKGHFIIDAFNRGSGRYVASTLISSGLPADSEQGRPSSVATFASRVFYAGVESNVEGGDSNSPDYSGTIFFTKVVNNDVDVGKCHSENDPTSEEISDLLATDGGTIKILGAGNILRLVVLDTSLLAIADNGIWQITGRDGVFKADDFSIRQITNIGAISKSSVVVAESSVVYWADGGIYVISPSDQLGNLNAQNISETTIQSLYLDIPSVGRANAVGSYDPANRKVSWLYNDTDAYDGVSLRKRFNRELTFDTVLQAFYTSTIGDSSNGDFIAGYMVTETFNVVDNVSNVVVDGDQVQVDAVDVVITDEVRTRGASRTKYLTVVPNAFSGNIYGISFSQYSNEEFKDWGEVDAAGYLVTGHELFGDTMRKKQANYLVVHMNRTETGFEDTGGGNLEALNPSSVLIQSRWDFSNSSVSGKWGTQFQAYRLRRPYFPSGEGDTFDYGWEVITTKNRLRGSGRALSLRFDTEPGKDFYLLGWGMDVTGATTT